MNVKQRLACVAALTLLGFALRFYQLNRVPLRGDEAFTVLHWMREPLASTLANIATKDPQAPLSYVLYRAWGFIMGTSENVARILPALLNVLGIPVMYALGHRLRGWRLGLLAALLWSINAFQIWHAQDARNYAIWAVLSPLAVWLALRALDRQRRIDWLLYVIAAALAGYVYYLELFVVAALNLYALLTRWRDRQLLIRWFGAEVMLGLILAPWYLQPRLLFGSGYGGTTGNFDPVQWFTRFLPSLTFGDTDTLPPDVLAWLAPLLVIALAVGLFVWWRRNRQQALLVGLIGIVPLILLGVVSLKLGVFTPRYVIGSAPAYTLIVSMLVLVANKWWLRGVVLTAVVLISLFSLNQYFLSDYAKSPDWRALVRYLQANVQPGDWVTQAAADESFTFYCNEYAIPANCDDKLPANPEQTPQEIDSLLTMRSAQSQAIWYVAQPPLGWSNAQAAENWLNGNLQLVRSTWTNGMRAQEFKNWSVRSAEIAALPLATFGDVVQLRGIQAFREPTDDLTVWLYWQPLTATPTPLKVFLHLRPDNGAATAIAAQDDQFPQDGRVATTDWLPGELYRDVYTLPLTGVAPGDYALVVGFYDPETNRRLPVEDGDSFTIQTISVP